MLVSVIISNFNGAQFLPRLLDSLLGQQAVDLDLIVVDRQSRDASSAILLKFPAVRVFMEPPETGLVAGYHRGYREARGEFLFFCNEDMWFEPDCLARLVGQIDLNKRIGLVDPWQWTYDGSSLIHAGSRFRSIAWDLQSPYPWRRVEFHHHLASGTEIPIPCAGAVLVHRQVYEEIGGWDTSFFLNHEDTDLALRAWRSRWLCVTEPRAKVYHAVGASNAQTLPNLTQSVSRRRYVSSFSSLAILVIKYFPVTCYWTILANWLMRLMLNLTKGRWKFLPWDFEILQEIKKRFPSAHQYRLSHGQPIGKQFFLAPKFQNPPGG